MLDFYHFPKLDNYPAIKHMVTTKAEKYPYHFSLALHTGEEETVIVQNRHALANAMGISTLHFVVANQTHSDNIHIVSKQSSQGWEQLEDAIENCDALITQQRHVVLSILTADCVPVLLYDPIKKVIAAVHAGWKGTKANIVAKTVQTMCDTFGSEAKNIIAAIAPSIGKCCYEVDDNVAKHFNHISDAYTSKADKYMLDLPHINQQQLLKAGLKKKNIEMSNICTACQTARFFSYRQEKGCSGRFMSMIVLV